jgi:hypothetical protein
VLKIVKVEKLQESKLNMARKEKEIAFKIM